MDKRKLSIILAVVLAVTAVVMVRGYISQTEKQFIKEERKAYVVVATANIPTGATIDESMITIAAVPENYVQPKALSSTSMVVGKRAIADIFPGEQLMSTKLTIATKDTSLAMRTPQGKRAITMTIPYLSAVGGKVRQGDYVDVMGTFPYNQQVGGQTTTELVSVTLFQNIQVLGIEGGAPPERGQAVSLPTDLALTLALNPKEIAILTYALDQGGKIRLVLRPPLETTVEPVPPVEVNTLWRYVFSNLGQEFMQPREEVSPVVVQQKPQEKPAPPEPPPPQTVEIYRGTEKSDMIVK